jgi:hypothetical protein
MPPDDSPRGPDSGDPGPAIRIEPAQAKELVDRGAAVVLDVGKAPMPERIKGALRARPNELAGWLAVLPPGKSVVTYCT